MALTGGSSTALLVSPNAVDTELATRFLAESGIEARAFPDVQDVLPALDASAGCLILVEEALLTEIIPALRETLRQMPPWSDLPLIVVSSNVGALASLTAEAFPESGNVTLLERPLNPHTLVSAVRVALRAAARQREIGELLEQRAQAVKLRDEFLAMLAHELRNPLAPMRNAIYIMRKVITDNPVLTRATDALDRQVNHIVRMVDDLMDVARLERGKVVLKKRRVDLNRVVSSAVDLCLPVAQEKGHRIVVHFDTNALPADADPVRVEQIVCNLIHNSAKFTPKPGEVRVHTSQDGEFASVTVEDDGVGFDPARAEELFDPFLQANPTLERTTGGLGMGLTIVRRLALLHGGSVQAESAGIGKGARFRVRLPLAGAGVEDVDAREAPVAHRKSRNVVVVEDNPDIRETVRMLLTLWGHEVALASDGPAGLECVLKQRPDVALLDIGLPGMDGYELARAIRTHMPNGAIKLVAMTGYGQPTDREAAFAAGFDRHLLKPIEPQVLERLLEEE